MTDGTRDTSEKLSASTQSESSTACVAMTGVPFPPTSVKPVASTPSVFERLATAKKKVPIVIAERNPVNGVSSRPTSASVAAAIGASPAPRPPSAGPTTMNGSGRTINGKSSTASLTENQRPVAIGSLQRKVAAGVPVGPMLPLKSSSTSLNPAASGTKINETEPTDSTSTLFVERTSVTLSPTMAAGSSSPTRTSLVSSSQTSANIDAITALSQATTVPDPSPTPTPAQATPPKRTLPSTSMTTTSSHQSTSPLSSKIAAAAASRSQAVPRSNLVGPVNNRPVVGKRNGSVNQEPPHLPNVRPTTTPNVKVGESATVASSPIKTKSSLRSTSAPSERRITFAPGTIDPSAKGAVVPLNPAVKTLNRSTPTIRLPAQPPPRQTIIPASKTKPIIPPKTPSPLPTVTSNTSSSAQVTDDPEPIPSTENPDGSIATTTIGGYQIPLHHIQHLQRLELSISDQSKRIEDLEHQLKEAERREQAVMKEKQQLGKELEQLKKYMSSDYKTVDQLKAQLQEEHTTNASLIIFNRSLKTQLAEMEVIIDNLMQAKGGTAAQIAQAAMARMELESMKGPPPTSSSKK